MIFLLVSSSTINFQTQILPKAEVLQTESNMHFPCVSMFLFYSTTLLTGYVSESTRKINQIKQRLIPEGTPSII